jgi:DNA-binding MarR family transcriptional regulator/ribosomal protein S18 acetylase RimI-like enzyme
MDLHSMAEDIVKDLPHLFLGSRLKRLAEQMQGDVVRVTEGACLPIQAGQYPLLATLDRYGAKTIGALATAMALSQPTVTRAVSRLAEMGLVAVDQVHRDQRHKTVSLTLAGEAAMAASKSLVWPKVEAAVKEVTGGLTGSFLDQIVAIEGRLAERSLSERAATTVFLSPAGDADVPGIVALMNLAFRGVGSEASWNSEAGTIDGDRITEPTLRAELTEKLHAHLLVWRSETGPIQGCVWLEPGACWYLGSLAVDPRRQNSGLGRRLLAAAEDWAFTRGATEIRMTVVNVRTTLIEWYERRGYERTGETEPFPYGDNSFGTPRRPDLCFVVLRKSLG